MDWVLELEIPYLTVYALSTENISSRESEELDSLYDLYVTGLNEISEDPRIHSKEVKVRAAGRIEKLPERVRDAIENAEQKLGNTQISRSPSVLHTVAGRRL